ncbi:MAG: apolipoprotein N-acyltransferase [Alphaproteobacteria bacterium]|jgi:apolipoprotein N-acyltransferase
MIAAAMCADRAAAWVVSLSPWRRALAAIVAGAFLALALPPISFVAAVPVSFTLLLWLIDGSLAGGQPRRGAFALGWCFGFGFFVAGLYWIANALLVDAGRFGWLAPVAVGGLSAYFALFPALAVLVASWARPGFRRITVLAVAWGLAEILRGFLLTGFPWNPMGSIFAAWPVLAQGAAFLGVFGLSVVVVFIGAGMVMVAGADAGRGRWRLPTAAVVLLAVVWGGGVLRLQGAPPLGIVDLGAPSIRIVQAAIDQKIKWRPNLARQHFMDYVTLSRGASSAHGPQARVPVAVIWPETAVPVVYKGSAAYLRALAQAVPPGGILITGVVRRTLEGGQRRTPQNDQPGLWNSVLAIDGQGTLLARYDKHHLVPFGEYVPLARFNPLPKLTEGRVDFSAGPGVRTLTLPGLGRVSPLVCYEVIFPGQVIAAAGPRPNVLLNLTNDAWFGISTGPYQHLVAARLRAVEEGLPLIRAANTGISAVIDPYGREVRRLGLGKRGVIDVPVPAPLLAPTFYGRMGNWPILVLAVLLLVFGFASFRRGQERPGGA